MFHHLQHSLVDRYNPLFKVLESDVTSIENLNPSLTINSVTQTPMLRYNGKDATSSSWNAWIYGTNFSGPSVNISYDQGSPLLGTIDSSVHFSTASKYTQGSNTTYDITTEDFVFEAVLFAPNNTTMFPFGKGTNGSGARYLFVTGGNLARFFINDGVNSSNSSNSVTNGTWYHIIIFCDRSEASTNGLIAYVNGVVGTGSNPSAVGSLTNTGSFGVGGDSSGNGPFDGKIAYISMWKASAWLNNSSLTEVASIAKQRFHTLIGLYPNKFQGTAVATTSTRNSFAYLDVLQSDNVRELYLVGNQWFRTIRRNDINGNSITGLLSENSVQNKILQSEVFGTTWAKITGTDTISTNAAAAPNVSTTGDGLIADSSSAQHGVQQSVSLNGAVHTFSVWAKIGNQSWVGLATSSPSVIGAYFDISNGNLGSTLGTVIDRWIENWGNGWYRCGFAFSSTVASWTMQIYSASADNTTTFTGNGSTINTYLWGASLTATEFMPSYIPTTTVAVTRSADLLLYKGDDGNFSNSGNGQQGMISTKFLADKYTNTSTTPVHWSVSDGTTNNRCTHTLPASVNQFRVLVTATGSTRFDQNGTSDPTDGYIHSSQTRFTTSVVQECFDGYVEVRAGAATGFPTGITEIGVGSGVGASGQFDGVIQSFKVFGRPTNKV